jgi:predicted nuclease of predicted toxin-antitoxin system
VKLFIDRDLGKKLGNALHAVGVDVTNHIKRYPNADAESVPDRQWIPEAAIHGEVILTRDGDIHRIEAELAAVVSAGARCFVLVTGNARPFDYLRAIMIAWPQMERLVSEEPAPFMYTINRSGRVSPKYRTGGPVAPEEPQASGR